MTCYVDSKKKRKRFYIKKSIQFFIFPLKKKIRMLSFLRFDNALHQLLLHAWLVRDDAVGNCLFIGEMSIGTYGASC